MSPDSGHTKPDVSQKMHTKALLVRLRLLIWCLACAGLAWVANAETLFIKVQLKCSKCFPLQLRSANCCVSQGGTVVNADRQFGADVLIKDGLIHAVGSDLEVP